MRKFTIVVSFVLGLVVASVGTATAAALITGKDIKNGSIARKDLSKKVRTALGKTGARGATGSTGATGPAGAPAVTLYAEVDSTGALVTGANRHAVSATSISAGAGYQVTWDRDVSSCVPFVTVMSAGNTAHAVSAYPPVGATVNVHWNTGAENTALLMVCPN